MRSPIVLTLVSVGVILSACNRSWVDSDLREMQQKTAGEYIVRLLNETGELKQGSANLVLEFRNASDQQLVDVGSIRVETAMPMAGMPDMGVDANVDRRGQPGQYTVTTNFSMAGAYKIVIHFAEHHAVQFDVQVE